MSGDDRLLSVVRVAGEAFDPLPAGMVARLHFAVSLELMQAELATLQLDGLATVRALAPLAVTTVTFTATTISLMVTFEDTADGVRIDGWITGGGVAVELRTGLGRLPQVSDATGRLTWPSVPTDGSASSSLREVATSGPWSPRRSRCRNPPVARLSGEALRLAAVAAGATIAVAVVSGREVGVVILGDGPTRVARLGPTAR